MLLQHRGNASAAPNHDDTEANLVVSAPVACRFPVTPLTALGVQTRMQLSEMLNCRKVLRHGGYHRDWRGLAELANVRSFCNDHNDDPMHSVLTQWSAHNAREATFFHLLDFLSKIDRWDICDDIHHYLVKDALHYVDGGQQSAQATVGPTTPCNVGDANGDNDTDNEDATPAASCNVVSRMNNPNSSSSSDDDDENAASILPCNEGSVNGHNNSDNDSITNARNETRLTFEKLKALESRIAALTAAQQTTAALPAPITAVTTISTTPMPPNTYSEIVEHPNPLTRQDAARVRRGLPLEQYDAFVLYDEADQHYANEMQKMLEQNNEYNFSLVFKNRDLLGGTFFTDAVTELIENRCHYLLLILTKNFYREYENFFFINNTAALQISENSRRIIPLLYDFTKVRALRGVHMLKYGSEGFWGKLADSISIPRTTFISFNMHAYNSDALKPSTQPPTAPGNVNDEKLITKLNAVKVPGQKPKKNIKGVMEKVRDRILQKS